MPVEDRVETWRSGGWPAGCQGIAGHPAARAAGFSSPAKNLGATTRMEGVLAAFAQLDHDVRSDGTRAGMKAALETRSSRPSTQRAGAERHRRGRCGDG
jgi:hypothetical protein